MFNTLFKVGIGAMQDRFTWVSGLSSGALRTLAMLVFVSISSLAPQSAQATMTFIDDLYIGFAASNTLSVCGSCHADWGGRETRNNAGVRAHAALAVGFERAGHARQQRRNEKGAQFVGE